MTETGKGQGVSGVVVLLVAVGALMVGLFSGLVLGAAGGFLVGQGVSDDSSETSGELGVAIRAGRVGDDGDEDWFEFHRGDDPDEEDARRRFLEGLRDDKEDEDGGLNARPELRGPFEGAVPDAFEDGFRFMPGPGITVIGEEAPFLGVVVSTVGEGEEPPPTDAETGAYIEQIEPDSAAEVAGLLPGDVVLSFDGLAISTMEDLAEAVSETEVDDRVTLVVQRDGEEKVVDVKIGARPAPIPIQPGNMDELLEQMPPEMREHFRDMFEQRPTQPEA